MPIHQTANVVKVLKPIRATAISASGSSAAWPMFDSERPPGPLAVQVAHTGGDRVWFRFGYDKSAQAGPQLGGVHHLEPHTALFFDEGEVIDATWIAVMSPGGAKLTLSIGTTSKQIVFPTSFAELTHADLACAS